MLSISVLTALVAGLLVLISFAQPAADRLHLPYTVLLAILGTAVASLASFLLYTPLTDAFNDIAEPLVKFPINASMFLVVFLPLLLFHAALTIDVRELVDDVAPILTLAVLAVFVSAAGIGFTLSFVGGVPLTVALLLGSIVASTDPAAVVAIFRDLGVPLRLVRLVEGESLLNDAAAIVLFTTLLKIISEGVHPGLSASALHFAESFGGGLLLGFVGGRCRRRQRRLDCRRRRAGAAEAGQLALSGAGLGADRLLGQLVDLHHGLSAGAEALVHAEHS